MRVAFLTQDLQLSGGVGVVVEHARQLAAHHDFDVTLVVTRRRDDTDWTFRGLEHLHVVDLAVARHQPRFDIAVSTWWETTDALFELDAERYASFVQSLEDRFYGPSDVQRMHAALAQDMPVRHITEATWIAEALDALHDGAAPTIVVRNGIDKDIFAPVDAPPEHPDGPLRILIEGSPAIGFKGVDAAVAAAAAMSEERHVTLVSPDGASVEGVDVALGPLSHGEMAGLYGQVDVLLKLSRVEGMFGPPLEAFHRGATCVVTPVTGHEEYVVHGVNGLLVDFDDTTGTAAALDLLARDRRYLSYLRRNAVATAHAWPSWRDQGAEMAAALRAVRDEPPPSLRPLSRRLVRDIAATQADAERWQLERAASIAVLEEVQQTTAYRLGIALRRIALVALRPARGLSRRLRRS
ncbi:MAG TPA: glycosyltransferase family 4 protein [Solirubrobacteraceae bacterium]|nr:glycosyltransferase family 4 protein [Solirubrobacteraceae bacterium]